MAPDPSPADASIAAFPLARQQTRQGLVSYRTAGAGPALVLLHGIGNQSGSWVRQLDGLAASSRVVAWDAPGYGESAPLAPESPAAADYADALAAFLDALDIARTVLVGSSLGALMAGAFAAHWPERVAGLVLLSPAGGHGLLDAGVRAEKLATRIDRMARLGPDGMAQSLPPGMLAASTSATARAIAAWATARLRPDGYVQAARMLAQGRLVEDAARYPGPVLVVAASEDTITPAADCRRIADAYRHATFRLLGDAGHLSYLDAPAIVNEMIASFAARCAAEVPA